MPFKKKTTTTSAAEKPAKPKQIVVSQFNTKPLFVYFTVRTGEDGLLSNYCKLRINCNTEKNQYTTVFNSEAEIFDTEKFSYVYENLDKPEPCEAVATTLLQRFSMTTFTTNVLRRLPKNTKYSMYLRVAVARADRSIRVSLRKLSANGKELTKEDPSYRLFRKAVKLLPIAFSRVEFERGVKASVSVDKNKPAVKFKKTANTIEEAPEEKVVSKKVVKTKPAAAKPVAKKVVATKKLKKPVAKKPAASDDFEL